MYRYMVGHHARENIFNSIPPVSEQRCSHTRNYKNENLIIDDGITTSVLKISKAPLCLSPSEVRRMSSQAFPISHKTCMHCQKYIRSSPADARAVDA